MSERGQKVWGKGSTPVGLCFALDLEDVKNKNTYRRHQPYFIAYLDDGSGLELIHFGSLWLRHP